jgi:hypothetical protein
MEEVICREDGRWMSAGPRFITLFFNPCPNLYFPIINAKGKAPYTRVSLKLIRNFQRQFIVVRDSVFFLSRSDYSIFKKIKM